ncbi:hypothetical protein [Zhihengliuella halotolerans]|uniref:Aminoglycoside phosphotransferase n=1 Tax=Zhihengliuella halotolerans TaxID=370736 RepID=A0A4Q8AH09_9MICC|nr:hypothetical protein [Zhihengliuella halotolerans]RZU63033.1 hypothetical protein EV380_2640 [Zhihengliuella halotolerans]
MSIQRPQQPPSPFVIEAFKACGAPARVPGGEGSSWRVADLVFKPADNQEQLAWWAEAVADIGDPDLLRLPAPARTSSGALVVDGWTATHFLEGEHESGRWVDVARAGEAFCDLLEPIQRPGFLARRQDPWARADRIAWGEEPLTGFKAEPLVTGIIDLLTPLTGPEHS